MKVKINLKYSPNENGRRLLRKSGMGMGVDPRSPANRGSGVHPRSPANRGWGCHGDGDRGFRALGGATDQHKQRPASAADGSYLAASVKAPPPVEEEDRQDSSQRKLHTGGAPSDAGSDSESPR
jgi:hypothetical protein